jgi:hypothetical protein
MITEEELKKLDIASSYLSTTFRIHNDKIECSLKYDGKTYALGDHIKYTSDGSIDLSKLELSINRLNRAAISTLLIKHDIIEGSIDVDDESNNK